MDPSPPDTPPAEPLDLPEALQRVAEAATNAGPSPAMQSLLDNVSRAADARVDTMRGMLVDAELRIARLEDAAEDAAAAGAECTRRAVDADAARRVCERERDAIRHELDKTQRQLADAEMRAAAAETKAESSSSRLAETAAEATAAKRHADSLLRTLTEAQRAADDAEQRCEDMLARVKETDEASCTVTATLHELETRATLAEAESARYKLRVAALHKDLEAMSAKYLEAERNFKDQRLDLATARTTLNEQAMRLIDVETDAAKAARNARELQEKQDECFRRAAFATELVEWADADRARLFSSWHDADRQRLAAEFSGTMLKERVDATIERIQELLIRPQGTESERVLALRAEIELLQARLLHAAFHALYADERGESGLLHAREATSLCELMHVRASSAESEAARSDAAQREATSIAAAARRHADLKESDANEAMAARDAAREEWTLMRKQLDAAQRQATLLDEARQAAELRESAAHHEEQLATTRALAAERVAQRAEDERKRFERRAQDSHLIAEAKTEQARDADRRVATVDARLAEAANRVIAAEAAAHIAELDAVTMRERAAGLDDELSIALQRAAEAEGLAHMADMKRAAAEAHTHNADHEAAEATKFADSARKLSDDAKAACVDAQQRAATAEVDVLALGEQVSRLTELRVELEERADHLEKRAVSAETVAEHLSHKCKLFEGEAVAAQRRVHDLGRISTSHAAEEERAGALATLSARLAEASQQREQLLRDIADLKRQLESSESRNTQLSRRVAAYRSEVDAMNDAMASVTLDAANAAASYRTPAAEARTGSELEDFETEARERLERLEQAQSLRFASLRAQEAELCAAAISRRCAGLAKLVGDTEYESQASRDRDAALLLSAQSAEERTRMALGAAAEAEQRVAFVQAAHNELIDAIHTFLRENDVPRHAAATLLNSVAATSDAPTAELAPVYEAPRSGGEGTTEAATMRHELAACKDDLVSARRKLLAAQTEADESRSAVASLERRIAQALSDLSAASDRAEEAEAALTRNRREAEVANTRAASLAKDLEQARLGTEALERDIAALTESRDEWKGRATRDTDEKDGLEATIARLEAKHGRLERDATAARGHGALQDVVVEALEAKAALLVGHTRALVGIFALRTSDYTEVLEMQLRDAQQQSTTATRARRSKPLADSESQTDPVAIGRAGAPVPPAQPQRQPQRSGISSPTSSTASTVRAAAKPRRRGVFLTAADLRDDEAAAAATPPAHSLPADELEASEITFPAVEEAAPTSVPSDALAAFTAWASSTVTALVGAAQYATSAHAAALADEIFASFDAVHRQGVQVSIAGMNEALDEARLIRRQHATLNEDLGDANAAAMAALRRTKELESDLCDAHAATRNAESVAERKDEELEAVTARYTDAQKKIAVLIEELDDTRFRLAKAPMQQAALQEQTWLQLSETQRGVLEKAANIERKYAEVDEKCRDLEREVGRLERHAADCERRMQNALSTERSALQDVAGLKMEVEQRDGEIKTLRTELANTVRRRDAAESDLTAQRKRGGELAAQVRDLEMKAKMQRFYIERRQQAATADGSTPAAAATMPTIGPDGEIVDDGGTTPAVDSAKMLRDAIAMCTPAQQQAPIAQRDPNTPAPAPVPLNDLVSTPRAPPPPPASPATAHPTSGKEQPSLSDVATALKDAAKEVGRAAEQRRKADEARRVAELQAVTEENVLSLAELRTLLRTRAEALRRQELGLIEYQRRFAAFQDEVERRMCTLARAERNMRFTQGEVVQERDDLWRLVRVLAAQRGKARRHLREAESKAMELLDRSMQCAAVQCDGLSLTAGVIADVSRAVGETMSPLRRRADDAAHDKRLVRASTASAAAALIMAVLWLVLGIGRPT